MLSVEEKTLDKPLDNAGINQTAWFGGRMLLDKNVIGCIHRNNRHRMRDEDESCLHFFTVRALLNAPFCGDKVFTEAR